MGTDEYPDGPSQNSVWDVYTFSQKEFWKVHSEDVACENNGQGRDPSCDGDLDCCKSSILRKGFSYVVWWREMCFGSDSCNNPHELTGARNYVNNQGELKT